MSAADRIFCRFVVLRKKALDFGCHSYFHYTLLSDFCQVLFPFPNGKTDFRENSLRFLKKCFETVDIFGKMGYNKYILHF